MKKTLYMYVVKNQQCRGIFQIHYYNIIIIKPNEIELNKDQDQYLSLEPVK